MWSQRWFNVHLLSIQSVCSETAGLPLLKEVQNRLRSGAERASAILYQGAFSLLLFPLCWWEDALMGSCESRHFTGTHCKALLQERVVEMNHCRQRGLTTSATECDSCHYSWIKRGPSLTKRRHLEDRSGWLQPNSAIIPFPGTKAGM